MAHAELCPVCKGNGRIDTQSNVLKMYNVTCHGCQGKGWVEVSDNGSSHFINIGCKPTDNV